ncbi:hypothetical protein XFUD_09950 [Xylella fastidiosa]|nr:hypothetical protein XFUD_09950 [Xylella fastidiosa]QPB73297.1 hypothetical protein XFC3_12810 [Xylella fastidiosa]
MGRQPLHHVSHGCHIAPGVLHKLCPVHGNLEHYQQIIERIGPTRQAQAGHDRPVFIHHIVAANTVDELVMARRESKREVQDLLLEAVKRRETCKSPTPQGAMRQ